MQGSFANFFANRPTDNFGETAANLLQHKSPLCILSSLRVLNFAVEEDIAHIERLPAITSSHILAQSEVSRMRRYRSALQRLNTSSVWSTKAMVVQKYKAIESPGLPIILSNTNAETWRGAKEGRKKLSLLMDEWAEMCENDHLLCNVWPIYEQGSPKH